MTRLWLLPLAALSMAGAVSVAQAAPASPALGVLEAANSQLSVKPQQIHWRWHHHRRHHHHRHHRHHRHHHHHHGR